MSDRRARSAAFRWSRGPVSELFSGRNNSLGLLRLLLASAVVVSHASVLGFGRHEFGHSFSQGQIDLGKMAVFGFFFLSGILVTRSGNRLPVGRFLWHRALRLLPGFWVCMAVTAFAVAPFLYWRQHGSTAGFWDHPQGPFSYVEANWAVGIGQWGISDVLETASAKGLTHNVGMNGALWSLAYEILCYFGVALLALGGSLVRSRRTILAVAVILGGLVFGDAIGNRLISGAGAAAHGGNVIVPLMGPQSLNTIIYLGFAFALGAVLEVYKERVPVSDPLAGLSAVVFLLTLHYGYFFALGVPAFCYLLLWLAIRLPKPFQRIGAKHDYSYGIYIYGFLVQQSLAVLGGARWGFPAYLGLSLGGALVAAVLSWHLVERQAMRLKDLGAPRRPASGIPAPRSGAPAEGQRPVPVA
ncbi:MULTISPECIES: acyltransferase family protein [Streptomyces]|uniref:O-antigen acetylase n=1 Tax=Streptomyces spororaveus TaxID=284039 RepID=A0ABQ3TGA6_9ACTN|nr:MULTISPECIES: acyltransferase [Streptomyces]MCM9080228.1 acyltransferase [Streptomyces spororaveus]MCX5305365.1 acyltransferase [Streptomyces sp. NBC_00160]GHI79450.1 O-antigen acetylase [Streptomyces spororaveus]